MSQQSFDPNIDTVARLRVLAILAKKQGCNYPTEDSKALMVACAFHDCQQHHMIHLCSDFGYDLLQKFKFFFCSSLGYVGGRDPLTYSPFGVLGSEHPIRFYAAGFTLGSDCPLFDADTIKKVALLASYIPKRRSNGNVSLASCQTPGPKKKMGQIDGLCNLPGFRLCGAREQPSGRQPGPLQRCTTFVPPLQEPAPSVGSPASQTLDVSHY